MRTSTAYGTDPHCAYCGRPIVGPFVQGNAGPYHPACTQPPTQEPNRRDGYAGRPPEHQPK